MPSLPITPESWASASATRAAHGPLPDPMADVDGVPSKVWARLCSGQPQAIVEMATVKPEHRGLWGHRCFLEPPGGWPGHCHKAPPSAH